jgi:hypothetical protein
VWQNSLVPSHGIDTIVYLFVSLLEIFVDRDHMSRYLDVNTYFKKLYIHLLLEKNIYREFTLSQYIIKLHHTFHFISTEFMYYIIIINRIMYFKVLIFLEGSILLLLWYYFFKLYYLNYNNKNKIKVKEAFYEKN